ncbi:glucokinase [Denitratisoma oestradiolicum]|uniref:Glucokinase n=1 Tax=Denitratisoma oestradiolicum TaxID=311182 RepID=A0A6S6Y038_9PROT|nr:glucokinase [Denitratisoma oestradiolicum]TWO81770.1 glucokinase [Denitratisoma oestradiolicum]CAB1370728.1 Glucokinase [Denitratisoma oestradiolicum]
MRLCGDIGGTKALLALADETGTLHARRRLECANYGNFTDLLAEYLGGLDSTPTGGCLAVAGPIADDGRSARLTNLPWTLDAAKLEQRFGLPGLRLINDFAAAALGVTVAPPATLLTLQPGLPLADGVKLVVGAGTGLGMAVLVPTPEGWRVLPGEGGHVAFAPADEIQLALWQHLHARHGRVTWERVASGMGIRAMHRFLGGADIEPELIAARALTSAHSTEGRTMEMFLATYGAFVGDMALALMARGGVYLAGGITAKILPLMQSGPFLTAFNAKVEHAALATRMPVHVVTEPELGLRGAVLAAI